MKEARRIFDMLMEVAIDETELTREELLKRNKIECVDVRSAVIMTMLSMNISIPTISKVVGITPQTATRLRTEYNLRAKNSFLVQRLMDKFREVAMGKLEKCAV